MREVFFGVLLLMVGYAIGFLHTTLKAVNSNKALAEMLKTLVAMNDFGMIRKHVGKIIDILEPPT